MFRYIREHILSYKRATLLHQAEATESLRREQLFMSTYCNQGNRQWKQMSWPRVACQPYRPLSLGLHACHDESNTGIENNEEHFMGLNRYRFDPHMIVCNTFWKSSLTLNNFRFGDPLVDFGSLWPEADQVKQLVLEMHQAASLQRVAGELLCLSLRAGPLRILRAFIELGIIDADYVLQEGKTLLHLACISQNLDSVLYLSTAGARPYLRDTSGRDVYQVCNSRKILKLLPPDTGSKGARSPRGTPPLCGMDRHGDIFEMMKDMVQWEELQLILQQSSFDVNWDQDTDGDYLIHKAVRQGVSHTAALLGLVRLHEVDVDKVNDDGHTPLMLCSIEGHDITADVLMCVLGADPNMVNANNGWTALHYAVFNKHLSMTSLLMKRGADLYVETSCGLLPDDVIIEGTNEDCVNLVKSKRVQRRNDISHLVVMGQIRSTLLENSDLFQVDETGDTLLMLAARHNRVDSAEVLLQSRCMPIDAQNYKSGQTALAIAASKGHAEVIRMLLRCGAAVSIRDMAGHLALHLAVLDDRDGAVRVMLLYRTAWVGLQQALRLAKSPEIKSVIRSTVCRRQMELVTPVLFECAVTGNVQKLVALLEDGDDVNPVSSHGDWPVYLAATNGHVHMVSFLHQRGGDLCCQHATTGSSVLHAACRGSHVGVVAYILHHYARVGQQGATSLVNLRDADGKTGLQIAADFGYSRIVQLLLQFGASTAIVDARGELYQCRTYQGIQVLIEEARRKHTDRVMAAIRRKNGLSILRQIFIPNFDHHLQHIQGDSPLMAACYHGNLDIVNFLLECEQTTQFPVGSKCLHVGTELSSCDPGLFSELESSCETDSAVETDDAPDSSVLYTNQNVWACMESDTVPDHREYQCRRWNPNYDLHLADIKERLVRKCVTGVGCSDLYEDIYLIRHRRQSPCCCAGHVCWANPQTGSTALHRAVEGGDRPDLVRAVVRADPAVLNLHNYSGLTSLHLACKLGRRKVVRLLLEIPELDINTRTLDGSLAEELTSNRNLRQAVQNVRSRPRPARPPPGDYVTFRSSSKKSRTETSSVAESNISFEGLNTRFLLLKQRWLRKQNNNLRNQ